MRFLAVLLLAVFSTLPVRADIIDDAFTSARGTFEYVASQLGATEFGVDVAAYGDALAGRRFYAPHWGQSLELRIVTERGAQGSCARYAAYVNLPPRDGAVTLVLCPQFVDSGTLPLRMLTILHELVHVVAGPDECRAMAFAARIEHLAMGAHTLVDRYWNDNGCQGSAFSLP